MGPNRRMVRRRPLGRRARPDHDGEGSHVVLRAARRGGASRPQIAAHFDDNVFWGGLTYNTHPLGVAAAIAAIDVLEDDDLVGNAKRMEPVMRAHHEALAAKHPSVGRTATSVCSASSSW